MERKYLNNLIEWLNDPNKKPLLVVGARQVGKSYLVEQLFAKQYFTNQYLRIDCSKDDKFANFVSTRKDIDELIVFIELTYNFKFSSKSLLIIDEAQECPSVIQMMKHFCELHRDYPLIVLGSLVRVKLNRLSSKRDGSNNSFLFPVGKINTLTIYPLTFDEFLLNANKKAYELIKKTMFDFTNIDESLHKLFLEYLYDYLFIGGMPEAVNNFIENSKDKIKAYQGTQKILKDLYENYLNDMELYQASKESIIRSQIIFKNIFNELNKEKSSFQPSSVGAKLKNRDLISPLAWLETADVVKRSLLLKERVTSPLSAPIDSKYRLYLSDMGLFTCQSGLEAKDYIFNKDNSLSGVYFENYLSIELCSRNIPLFYWKGKRDSELEFLISEKGKIIPIDSKKTRGSLNSLKEFRLHNKLDIAIKVSKNQYGYNKENRILTIPFYRFSFLLDILDQIISQLN